MKISEMTEGQLMIYAGKSKGLEGEWARKELERRKQQRLDFKRAMGK